MKNLSKIEFTATEITYLKFCNIQHVASTMRNGNHLLVYVQRLIPKKSLHKKINLQVQEKLRLFPEKITEITAR